MKAYLKVLCAALVFACGAQAFATSPISGSSSCNVLLGSTYGVLIETNGGPIPLPMPEWAVARMQRELPWSNVSRYNYVSRGSSVTFTSSLVTFVRVAVPSYCNVYPRINSRQGAAAGTTYSNGNTVYTFAIYGQNGTWNVPLTTTYPIEFYFD